MRFIQFFLANLLLSILVSGCNGASNIEEKFTVGSNTKNRGDVENSSLSKIPSDENESLGDKGLLSSDNHAVRTDDAKKDLSMTEKAILRDGAIDVSVNKTLAGENFDNFINKFQKENDENIYTRELTTNYGKEVDRTLATVEGSSQLTRLTCGSTVCMGYINSTGDDSWFTEWYETFAESASMPVKAMTFESVKLPGGTTENRFLFTTAGDGGVYIPPGR